MTIVFASSIIAIFILFVLLIMDKPDFERKGHKLSAQDKHHDIKIEGFLEGDNRVHEKIRSEHPQLFSAISELLFKHDPIGISFGSNIDEYDPETGSIVPKLKKCASYDEVLTLLHAEFIKWHGNDATGDRSRFADLAKSIWILHQREWGHTMSSTMRPTHEKRELSEGTA